MKRVTCPTRMCSLSMFEESGIVNESGTYAELLNNFYDTFFCPDVFLVRILNLHTHNPTAIACRRWSLVANWDKVERCSS